MEQEFTEKTLRFFVVVLIGVMITILGAISNQIAVTNNGGRMPVYLEPYNRGSNYQVSYFYDKHHFTYEDKKEIKFWYLSDLFLVHFGVCSIGDILLVVGFIISFTFSMIYTTSIIKFYRKRK